MSSAEIDLLINLVIGLGSSAVALLMFVAGVAWRIGVAITKRDGRMDLIEQEAENMRDDFDGHVGLDDEFKNEVREQLRDGAAAFTELRGFMNRIEGYMERGRQDERKSRTERPAG